MSYSTQTQYNPDSPASSHLASNNLRHSLFILHSLSNLIYISRVNQSTGRNVETYRNPLRNIRAIQRARERERDRRHEDDDFDYQRSADSRNETDDASDAAARRVEKQMDEVIDLLLKAIEVEHDRLAVYDDDAIGGKTLQQRELEQKGTDEREQEQQRQRQRQDGDNENHAQNAGEGEASGTSPKGGDGRNQDSSVNDGGVNWNLFAALLFILTACIESPSTIETHSNVSTPLSPENSGFSWVQTSGTQATTTSTTYTSSTLGGTTNPPSPSYTIPSIVADFRLEKARSLVASITRRLEETPGAGKTGSESDRARVRGKRVLRKACQYATAHLQDASHPCECRSFWKEVCHTKHLAPEEITASFVLSSSNSHPLPAPIDAPISAPIAPPIATPIPSLPPSLDSNQKPMSPRELLGDIALPFPSQTSSFVSSALESKPQDMSWAHIPRFHALSRQPSSLFSVNSFSSLFSNPGEGLRRATKSSTAIPEIVNTDDGQAIGQFTHRNRRRTFRSPLSSLYATTSNDSSRDVLRDLDRKYGSRRRAQSDTTKSTMSDSHEAESERSALFKFAMLKGLRDRWTRSVATEDPPVSNAGVGEIHRTSHISPSSPIAMASTPSQPSEDTIISILSPGGRLASFRSPPLGPKTHSSPELRALIASGANLQRIKQRDWGKMKALPPLAKEFKQAEEQSTLTQMMTCAVCEKQGLNFPKCRQCHLVFCSRDCRVGLDGAGDGKKHVCGIWESRKMQTDATDGTDNNTDLDSSTPDSPELKSAHQLPQVKSGIHLGLQNMQLLMSHLTPMTIPYIHISGTNGKGSTSALLDSVCVAAGLQTGRYNSPHLITIRDSICINGKEVDSSIYDRERARVLETTKEMGLSNSEFEITTATAFSIFATFQPPLDIMIIECGMGGLRDATNVLPADKYQMCSVLTAVDLDHQGFLGNTVEEIASDKLGILTEDGVLIVGEQCHDNVIPAVEEAKSEKRADVTLVDQRGLKVVDRQQRSTIVRAELQGDSVEMKLPLQGPHQLSNLATTLKVLDVIRKHPHSLHIQPSLSKITNQAIVSGIANTRWKGRCDWVDLKSSGRAITVLTDGAHNASAAKQLRYYISDLKLSSDRKVIFILGLSHSPPKTALSVLAPLLIGEDKGESDIKAKIQVIPVLFTTPVEGMPWIKPVPLEDVAAAAQQCGADVLDVKKENPTLKDALAFIAQDRQEEDLLVVTGSLYLVADVYRLEEGSSSV